MSLAPGTRLGPYIIEAPLGAGGMGEVYKATDTRLNRTVAIKALHDLFAQHPERVARFEREAQILASLNHPNIAAIHGLEEVGPSAGSGLSAKYLILEFVDGRTLADTIAAGQGSPTAAAQGLQARGLPLADALAIAKQIAEALTIAHERGIIHRDLKPGNVMLTPDGQVKVLDFGLGKALESDAASNAAHSPTLTMATQAGVILGTAGYMSPEQAKGRAADKRSDVWAFGCVLYEMLTGHRAFDGEDITETLAAIVRGEPDWTRLPADLPPAVRVLLERCLVKDRAERLADMSVVRFLMSDTAKTLSRASATTGVSPTLVRQTRPALVWALAAIAAAALAVAAFALWNRPAAVQQTSARLTIPLPPNAEVTSYPAISRDGRTVAYVARQGTDDSQLYLRDLNAFDARVVTGANGARQPFFSPDGKWIAFFAQGQLQKAEVAGGAPIRIAEAAYPFGGTWTEDNTIIYAASLSSGLLEVPASGGTPKAISKPDAAANGYAHVFPQALPLGRSLLFTVWGQNRGGAVLSLDSGQWEIVLPATTFAAAMFDSSTGASGRLLVVDEAAGIRAAAFDPARPTRTSADVSVLDNVFYDIESESKGWLAVSDHGTAVYAPGSPAKSSLAWLDREGKIEALSKEQTVYREVSIAPDGAKAVVRVGVNLWIHDLQRGTRSPLTSGKDSNILPVWSRDSRRIFFASNRGGDWDMYSQSADGSGVADVVLKRPSDQFPYAVSSDGTLLYTEIGPKTGRDLWTLTPDGKVSPLRVTPFNEWAAQFSPGPGIPRWVAYASDESGRSEIYVQSYPEATHRIPVSTGGGVRPMWSPDGQELFFMTGDALVAVTLQPDGTFGAPRRLSDRSSFFINDRFHCYSVSPDGKRFLMIQRDPASVPRQLNVILNWSDQK